jgi:hypothetical protein
MGANVATANRLLAPAGISGVDEDKATSWSVGDRLLMIVAAFIALMFLVSGLALLVIASAAFFE